mmetsp:Transcript_147009/g.256672  ORF Transcript_147009/g.256672 Transcript_147009/m.256672 type:complete len:129 (-) Transcript_147009:130-516(-)
MALAWSMGTNKPPPRSSMSGQRCTQRAEAQTSGPSTQGTPLRLSAGHPYGHRQRTEPSATRRAGPHWQGIRSQVPRLPLHKALSWLGPTQPKFGPSAACPPPPTRTDTHTPLLNRGGELQDPRSWGSG